MVSKIKNLSVIGFVFFLLGSLWLYFTIDMMVVSEPSLVSQNDDLLEPIDVNIALIQDRVNFEPADAEFSENVTQQSRNSLNVPEPEERTPGTQLTEEVKSELGITEDIFEEQVFYTAATPDDTIYPQWYTTTIDAPTAWDRTTGSSSTLVAVIDTGFALDHEDLNSAWFINSGEQGTTQLGDACWDGTPADKQTNDCDDDGNGFDDDWRGWDFSNNDNSPQAGDNYAPGSTHGTKSAGLVGARGNNGTGVASVNWETQILPLQALYDQGYGYSSDITGAIYYAVEMGADVINMSLGGPTPDYFTLAAVQYAQQNNVIVVASAGNCGDNQTDPDCIGYASPGGMGYPARYNETIAVGATTPIDERAYFSSYGPELDIVAPGSGSIKTPTWSTTNGTDLYSLSSFGTSFSAPIVAGAIALVRGEDPTITSDEILKLFYGSSDRVSGMGGLEWTEEYGFGRLNVNNLLDELTEYQEQLRKTAGQTSEQSSSTTPLLTTNRGHTLNTMISSDEPATTYCITTPQTLCTLSFKKRGSSETTTLGSVLSNNQGLALFQWDGSDLSSYGIWDARVTANGVLSTPEKVITTN